MKEIKFRGQTRRKGEYLVNMARDKCDSNWVYGGIFPQNKEERGFAVIYQQEPEIKKYPVYADTVGQYIGIKDKNKKEIYEGDICKYYNPEDKDGIAIIRADYVEWISGTIRQKEIMTPLFYLKCSEEWEVIGNIYDNPELLKDDIPRNPNDAMNDGPLKHDLRKLTNSCKERYERAIKVMQQHKCEEISLYGEEYNLAISALQEIQKYLFIGTIEDCQKSVIVRNEITEIVNRELIAGNGNYKEIYNCFYDIVKVIQDNY